MSEEKKTFVRAVPWTTPTAEKVQGALGELPAYVRRARKLEVAVEDLFREAREAREEMLEIVCLRFRQVLDVLEEPDARALPEETVRTLGFLLDQLQDLEAFYRLADRTRAPRGKREVSQAFEALNASIDRFNRRYEEWIAKDAPLASVNARIEGYNRHYSLERQCALRYVSFDQLSFKKKEPLGRDDLLERLPLLPRVSG